MSLPKIHRVTAGRAIKLSRVVVSAVFLLMMTALLTALSARVALGLHWVARIQVFPLALAGAVGALVTWFGITMLFGRVYCSSVCPMGTLQDIFSHLCHSSRIGGRAPRPFRYSLPRNRFRYAFLCIVAGCAVVGAGALPSLFDPYSAFGRIASNLVRPVLEFVVGEPVLTASWLAFVIAVVTFLAVGAVSYMHGRLICNTVCPVGSTLGIFSRYSLFHFDIDTDLCINCRKCEHVCKAECINMADHVVDGSRCVACFNCMDVCENRAMRYTWRRKKLALPMMQRVGSAAAAPIADGVGERPVVKDDTGGTCAADSCRVGVDRRKFLATGLIVATAPALGALAKGADAMGGRGIGGQRHLTKARPVAPPGRRSLSEFMERCTGCGLCVAHCSSKVLRPSANEYGWLNMLHPVLDFGRAYCLYNCTVCTEVCPTGALLPLTRDEKHIFIIGHASVEAASCIGCGRCAARCPRKAVTMNPRTAAEGGAARVVACVDTTSCIGCGACEYVCPVHPVKAIGVDGIV